jgi:NitT/TauT family transport system substrate-binding protein
MYKRFFSCTLIVLMLLLQGCQAATTPTQALPKNQTPTTEAGPATIKLKVQLLPYLSYAPLYIAQEEGYFAEQGLEVEFEKLQGGAAFVALVSGDIDVAATFLTSNVLEAIRKGETVKVVADKGYIAPSGCTANGLLARKDLVDSGALNDVKGLVGRTVKYDKVSAQAYFLDLLLKSGGYSLADVEYVDFNSSPVVMEAFRNKAVDVAAESEPWLTRNINTGNAVVWKDYSQIAPNFQFAFIIFGKTLLKDNPEAGRRFMLAYLKAVQQYNQGKTDRNMALMEAFTEEKPEALKQICWPTFRNDLMINTQSVLDFQDWAIQSNLLESPVKVEQFWDPAYVEYALGAVK